MRVCITHQSIEHTAYSQLYLGYGLTGIQNLYLLFFVILRTYTQLRVARIHRLYKQGVWSQYVKKRFPKREQDWEGPNRRTTLTLGQEVEINVISQEMK